MKDSSAKSGALLLTLAQAWHALSGYLIFVTGARLLGPSLFGRFGLVIWTMTALETFVVSGVPKAVSYHVARGEGRARALLRRGLLLTFGTAVALAIALVLSAPLLATLWRDESLVFPTRLSALDFLAFAPFAVLVQVVNGLRDFKKQAIVWLIYSSVKVLAVLVLLYDEASIQAGVLGYVIASLVASIEAFILVRGRIAKEEVREAPQPERLWSFAWPLALQALALLLLLNLDQWAATRSTDDVRIAGLYVAASTLARVIFFVFSAFGEALFPSVARDLEAGDRERAAAGARDALALLLAFVLPTAGLAIAAAEPSLIALYGDDYRGAAPFLRLLAPATVGLTLAGVLASLIAAAGRPRTAASLFCGLLLLDAALVFGLGSTHGIEGAAWGALITGGLASFAAAALCQRIFQVALLPWRALIGAAIAGLAIYGVVTLWSPPGWLVFPYGGLLLGVALAGLLKLGCWSLPKKKPRASA